MWPGANAGRCALSGGIGTCNATCLLPVARSVSLDSTKFLDTRWAEGGFTEQQGAVLALLRGSGIGLTVTEYELLCTFESATGRVLTSEDLLLEI